MATRIEPTIGKYYTNGCKDYARVDGLESGVPYGVSISYFEGFVCIAPNTSLDMFFYVGEDEDEDEFSSRMKEISKEEFEQELEQAREEFESIYKQIRATQQCP